MSERYTDSGDPDEGPFLDDISLAILSGQQHEASQMIADQLGIEPIQATQGKRQPERPNTPHDQLIVFTEAEQYALINGVTLEEATVIVRQAFAKKFKEALKKEQER